MAANIDRRITVLNGTEPQRQQLRNVSDLRALNFYVLLGEPGIGKTSTFNREAAAEGGARLTVRQLLTGFQATEGKTLFLDGLDEYRIDGNASEKVTKLAAKLIETKPPRWRLACRSEDWRAEADMAQIANTASNEAILVVQLQPLDENEQTEILESLGEAKPAKFLEQARSYNASAFCESPLSLGLLYKTVSGSGICLIWPKTRQELFSRSIERLAYEQNPEYKSNPRRSKPVDIIRAAGSAFLLMLVSGASGFWRSNGEPPETDDAHGLLSAHELSLSLGVLQDMLDTALFKGEGEWFEPMHRTIAEYLAAETLAGSVVGQPGLAALPLSRALALISGFDGRPPTELRGLFAWFPVHLMRLGDEHGARHVAEADPMTSIGYGDAASFNTPIRRAIFQKLASQDPFFRASEVGLTYVASLAGEDLAEDFKAVLNDRTSIDHRMLTVIDALTSGSPVQSLRPLLRDIVLDSTRPGWQRVRVFHAWHNGSAIEPGSVRALFHEVSLQPVSIEREDLRINMASAFSTSDLSINIIKSVVAAFQRCPEDGMTGRLARLQQRLDREPPIALFDEPTTNWLWTGNEHHHTVEIELFLDRTLAAGLRTKAELTAQQLVHYVHNASRGPGLRQPREATLKQVHKWLDERPGRDIELFDLFLSRDSPSIDKPVGAIGAYIALTARDPSISVIRLMLARSQADITAAERHSSLAAAVALANRATVKESFWAVYEEILKHPAEKGLLESLTIHQFQDWELDRAAERIEAKQQRLTERAKNLARLSRLQAGIESGRELGELDWAARLYFRSQDRGSGAPASLDEVVALTDASMANSLSRGWLRVVNDWPTDAVVLQIGASEVTPYSVEGTLAALAGLIRILKSDNDMGTMMLPIGLAAVVFTSLHNAMDDSEQDLLENWALNRVEHDGAMGSRFLVALWSAVLSAGGLQLAGLQALSKRQSSKAVLNSALDSLLLTYPTMPVQTLKACLTIAATVVDRDRTKAIVAAAIGQATVVEPQRSLWTLVAFALEPEAQYQSVLTLWSGRSLPDLYETGFSGNVLDAFVQVDTAASALATSLAVRLFGPGCGPEDEQGKNRNSAEGHMSSTVRHGIGVLTVNQTPRAREILLSMSTEVTLARWGPTIKHALAEQANTKRDRAFKHPEPGTIRRAIAGGPPINAADLRAIVECELRCMQREMHTGPNQPWRLYWDLRSNEPLIENDCRDRLLERLIDRLRRYSIADALAESRRGEQTRSDVLVLSGAGKNLPIEAKVHSHAAIWTAASTQLQGYSADPGAEGHGIYLVFWFGNETTPTQARPDGAPGPTNAAELEKMLIDDLSPELRSKTAVVVLDVADPNSTTAAKPRKRRSRRS